jgi:spore coat protein CotH
MNRCISVLFFLLILFGCSKDPDSTAIDDPTLLDFELPLIIPTGDENYLNTGSKYIFDQDTLRTFELEVRASALAKIDKNPAAEQYVEGMLICEGDTISPIGVRYKGSIGAFVNCVSGNDWANPSGSKTCTKLSMKVKINWGDREEKFFNLKKLQFHSQNNDPSQMRERLGYWLFKEMGVPSPRSVHAKVIINGEYMGLFALTEQIDGRFVKRNFDDDEGNLYKEIWPLNMDGVPYADFQYLSALKTNEDENPSIEIIKNFGSEIANNNFLDAKDIVESQMILDEILSYIVVDRTIKHDDGPFHWYCFNGCNNHNYYIYEEPINKKLHLIPWDLDNAFENIISDANPVTPIADDIGETSNNCKPFSDGAFGLQQWSASCDKLTAIWASYTEELENRKGELLTGPMSKLSTDAMLDMWSDQIRDATMEASELHGDAITSSQWISAINLLKNQLEYARKN